MPGEEKQIGKFTQKNDVVVEWTIEDILSYTKENVYYTSPPIQVPGSQWCLAIYPNGCENDKSVGWISLYLFREGDFTVPKVTDFTFELRQNGTICEKISLHYVFATGKDNGFGKSQFYPRSKPGSVGFSVSLATSSKSVTITCLLKVTDAIDCCFSLNKLSEDLKDTLNSKRNCDTTLTIKDQKFYVHKSILSARSPVLAAMFEVDMKEKNTGTVDIVDCQPDVFRDFLAYVYSGEFENISNNVFELYRIADKYGVDNLKRVCIAHMLKNLSIENLFDAVILANQYDESKLKDKTQVFFNVNFTDIVPTTKWDSFLKDYFDVGNGMLKNMAANMKSTTQQISSTISGQSSGSSKILYRNSRKGSSET